MFLKLSLFLSASALFVFGAYYTFFGLLYISIGFDNVTIENSVMSNFLVSFYFIWMSLYLFPLKETKFNIIMVILIFIGMFLTIMGDFFQFLYYREQNNFYEQLDYFGFMFLDIFPVFLFGFYIYINAKMNKNLPLNPTRHVKEYKIRVNYCLLFLVLLYLISVGFKTNLFTDIMGYSLYILNFLVFLMIEKNKYKVLTFINYFLIIIIIIAQIITVYIIQTNKSEIYVIIFDWTSTIIIYFHNLIYLLETKEYVKRNKEELEEERNLMEVTNENYESIIN